MVRMTEPADDLVRVAIGTRVARSMMSPTPRPSSRRRRSEACSQAPREGSQLAASFSSAMPAGVAAGAQRPLVPDGAPRHVGGAADVRALERCYVRADSAACSRSHEADSFVG